MRWSIQVPGGIYDLFLLLIWPRYRAHLQGEPVMRCSEPFELIIFADF